MVLTEQGFATSPTAPWTDGTLDDGFNDMGEL